MIRSVLLALACSIGGCTLLLPTEELIKPCVDNGDCDEGFACEDNACLPLDDGVGAGGEGEGE
jgi:hypothetical protein